MQTERLLQVLQSLRFGLALTRNVNVQAFGHIPLAFLPYTSSEIACHRIPHDHLLRWNRPDQLLCDFEEAFGMFDLSCSPFRVYRSMRTVVRQVPQSFGIHNVTVQLRRDAARSRELLAESTYHRLVAGKR
jgi:hypothetical protein